MRNLRPGNALIGLLALGLIACSDEQASTEPVAKGSTSVEQASSDASRLREATASVDITRIRSAD